MFAGIANLLLIVMLASVMLIAQSLLENPRVFPLELILEKKILLHLFIFLFKDQEIILYCKNGYRSSIAAKILIERGFVGKIYNMIGGIDEWKEAGFPTAKG